MIISSRSISIADVVNHYDELDSFYRELWGEHVHHGLWQTGQETCEQAVTKLVELVAKQAEIGIGDRVLDIGCGYGATARMLVKEYGADVTAITLSPTQYRYACSLDPTGNPKYLLGDWLATEFPPKSFEAAVAIESSEHMPDAGEFFARVFAMTAADGRLVVCSWLAKEDATARQRRWFLEPICREGRIPRLHSAQELIKQAEAAGFRVGTVQDLTDQVWRTWPIVVGRFVRRAACDPRYRSFLLDPNRRNRMFALTIGRIWAAYRIGALRYGLFQFVKGNPG